MPGADSSRRLHIVAHALIVRNPGTTHFREVGQTNNLSLTKLKMPYAIAFC